MKENKLCIICSQNKQKYKCPKCSIQYCGLDCFKQHKCEEYQQNNDKKQQINVQENQEQIHKSNYVEDEELRVPKAKLESIRNSEKIKKILKSSKLRETLLKIDNARSRLWELNNEMKTNKYFMDFTQLLLGEMGMLNENNEFI